MLLFHDGLFFPPEHLEHAIGHQESAHDVDGRHDQGDETKNGCHRTTAIADRDQRPDHRNSADRVGSGHERRVQGRWNFGDNLKTDEYSQCENRQAGDQCCNIHHVPFSNRLRFDFFPLPRRRHLPQGGSEEDQSPLPLDPLLVFPTVQVQESP